MTLSKVQVYLEIVNKYGLADKGEEKKVSEANDEDKPSKYSSDLFTSCMNSWYDHVNTWSNLYAEFIRKHQR